MATNPKCPNCGVELAPDAPRGLCPQCLLKAGLASDDDNTPTINSETGPDGTLVTPVPGSSQHQEALASQRKSTTIQTLVHIVTGTFIGQLAGMVVWSGFLLTGIALGIAPLLRYHPTEWFVLGPLDREMLLMAMKGT